MTDNRRSWLAGQSKADDPRAIGEKAIGILAFQQLGGRCEIVTRPLRDKSTHALRLVRGEAIAMLEPTVSFVHTTRVAPRG